MLELKATLKLLKRLHDTLRKTRHIHQSKSHKNFINDIGRVIGPTLQGFERGGSSITNALDRTIKDSRTIKVVL